MVAQTVRRRELSVLFVNLDEELKVVIDVVEAEREKREEEGNDEKEDVDRGVLESPPPGILKKHGSYDMAVEHGVQGKSEELGVEVLKKEVPKRKGIPPWKLVRQSCTVVCIQH